MECIKCGHEMVFEILDENGAHYECLNCEWEYCDESIIPEDNEDDDEI